MDQRHMLRTPAHSDMTASDNKSHPYLRVWAPSRLHWGLLNESGIDGRVDGGVGVGVVSPAWRFRIGWELPSQPSNELHQVAASVISRLSAVWGGPPCSIAFDSVIPLHVGLLNGAQDEYVGVGRRR
jgi:predicted sugar kinase